MANKKKQKENPAEQAKKTQASQEDRQQKKKKEKGPSRLSGAISIGLAIFGMLWTFTIYRMKGPGFQALFGVVFVVLCVLHGFYNFHAVDRQEAIERGEIPDPEKKAAEEAAAKASKARARRYPVYRVKKKPVRAVKRRKAAISLKK